MPSKRNPPSARLVQAYQTIFAWFAFPEQMNHPVRAHQLHGFFLVFAMAEFFMATYGILGMRYISHPSINWFPWVGMVLAGLSLPLQRWKGNMALNTLCLLVPSSLYILLVCWLADGFRLSAFSWLATLPLAAGVLMGRRHALAWSCLALPLALGGHLWAMRSGATPLFKAGVEPECFYLSLQAGFFICVGVLTYFINTLQEVSSRHLREKIVSKQNLLRILVHDISTPLTVIRVMGQLLGAGVAQVEPAAAGLKIEQNVDRISNIIQLIREMESWEDGKQRLKLAPLNLTEVLDQLLEQNQGRITSKKLRINRHYAGDEHVWGHPAMLADVVLGNLLVNAFKFSHEGGKIDVAVVPISRHEVAVVVRDYGVGIPAKLLKDIFDPLAPTTRPGTAGEKGTGFGLPIAKNGVGLLGGRITVESRTAAESPEDHGTRISVVLRRSEAPEPQPRNDNS